MTGAYPMNANSPMSQPLDATHLHPRVYHFLKGLPREVRDTFTNGQIEALSQAFGKSPSRHRIDFRVSVATPFRRAFYVTLLAGPEKRNVARLDAEGQRRATRRAALFVVGASLAIGCLLFGAFTLLYLVKCMLGINIFKTYSPLHPVYQLFFR